GPFVVTVNDASQTVAFTSTAPAAPVIGDTYNPAATATSGLPVALSLDDATTEGACTFDNTTVHFTGEGSCIVDADQAGDADHAPAVRVQQSLIVTKHAQTISFAAPSAKTIGFGSFSLNATATSSLAVTFSTPTTSICTISGTTLTLVAVGTC